MSDEKKDYVEVSPDESEEPEKTKAVHEKEDPPATNAQKAWQIIKFNLTPNKNLTSLKCLGLLFFGGKFFE